MTHKWGLSTTTTAVREEIWDDFLWVGLVYNFAITFPNPSIYDCLVGTRITR